MIIPLVIGCLFGAAVISRGSPKTRVKKLTTIGTTSGAIYHVEEMPEAGVIVVHAPGCVAVFQRGPDGGFRFLRGRGDQKALVSVVTDIAPRSLQTEEKKS